MTVGHDRPPESVWEFNEADFERAGYEAHERFGPASPESLNRICNSMALKDSETWRIEARFRLSSSSLWEVIACCVSPNPVQDCPSKGNLIRASRFMVKNKSFLRCLKRHSPVRN